MLLISLMKAVIYALLGWGVYEFASNYDIGGLPLALAIFFAIWIANLAAMMGESWLIDQFNPEESNER